METESDGGTEFSLYFPSQIPEKIVDFRNCEERHKVVVGETIDVIIVAKNVESNPDEAQILSWKNGIESLCSLLSISTDVDCQSEKLGTAGQNDDSKESTCFPFSSHSEGVHSQAIPWLEMEDGSLICHQRTALTSATALAETCTINVALWCHPVVNDEVTSEGILETFLRYTPEVIMQQYGRTLRQELFHTLPVMTPPTMTCRHANTAGNHYVAIKVKNEFSNPVKIVALSLNPDDSPTPISPQSIDSREFLQEKERSECSSVSQANQFTVKQPSCSFPMTLTPGECHAFLCVLQVKDTECTGNYSNDLSLVASMKWSRCDHKPLITTYKLPSLHVRWPGLVITAEPPHQMSLNQPFMVRYTIHNYLQDFISLKLVWNPGKALTEAKAKESGDYKRSILNVLNSVICHQPSVALGACKSGSVIETEVGFTLLHPGMYELGQHMKLTLQYQAANVVRGHQRKGSITSTHSMPSDPRRDITMTTRSASMCPLDSADDYRRGSFLSNRVPTPAHSPPVGSPMHRKSADSLSTVSNTAASDVRPAGHSAASSGRMHVERSLSALSSPSRPSPLAVPGNITSQQVLKRNCQVYVMAS